MEGDQIIVCVRGVEAEREREIEREERVREGRER